ncbi:MAG: Ig-like domain-containing protein [Bacteroidales bacterium]|nr:Ig-like domain-containing protein [Bacteroidales bacterium]
MKKNSLIPILACAAVFIPIIFTPSCANTTQAPTGGLKDTIPPVILNVTPPSGGVNVALKGLKIVLEFDEFATVKNNSNIIMSPSLPHPPKCVIRGKSLVVTFEDSLSANTTYSISFDKAIGDLNEGNLIPGFTYVFSTGNCVDSMYVTGTVRDSKKMEPAKDVLVLFYKDLSDSALFKSKPYAYTRTDDWGYFSMAYLSDTLYRVYAMSDANNNMMYDPETEDVGFIAGTIRPETKVTDSLPDIMKFDPKDTVSCMSRKSQYDIVLFRERPTKQYIESSVRLSEKSAQVKFFAPNVWIDSVWVPGFTADRLITRLNEDQDTLQLWINDPRPYPDTMHLFVAYRKTGADNHLQADLEHLKLLLLGSDGKPVKKKAHQTVERSDTICKLTLTANPKTVEEKGVVLSFDYPIVEEHFADISFTQLNARQVRTDVEFRVEPDSTSLLQYIIKPVKPLEQGLDYYVKLPYKAFRDINGFYSDSLETRFALPNKETMSSLILDIKGTGNASYNVELLNKNATSVIHRFWVTQDGQFTAYYLDKGEYCIRISRDENGNRKVDTGSVLEQRQPEKVRFFSIEDNKEISVPENSEVSQEIDLQELFKD